MTENLVGEKLIKRYLGWGYPHAPAIRAGLQNIHYHLDYIAYLAERRNWLAGDDFSMADISAGAHLSAVDYLWRRPVGRAPRSPPMVLDGSSRAAASGPLLTDSPARQPAAGRLLTWITEPATGR